MDSYRDMMSRALNDCKKEIDRYFECKVKEFENKLSQIGGDPYPEELYVGISTPSPYFMFVDEQKWDVLLFNRKLMEYKAAYLLNGQEFFDEDCTLPVSKGWEYYCRSGLQTEHVNLSCFHARKAKELKLNWIEYNEKYLSPKGWFK